MTDYKEEEVTVTNSDLEEILKKQRKKRIQIATGVGLAILLGFGGCASYNALQDKQETVITTEDLYSLTEQEESEVKLAAAEFITEAGTFGTVKDSITPNNYESVGYIIGADAETANNYYLKRSDAYTKLRDSKINPRSDVYYSNNFISDNLSKATLERQTMTGYSARDSKVLELSKGYTLKNGTVDAKAVDVKISFETDLVRYVPTGTGADWDGTIEKQTASFKDEGTITLIQEGSRWLVYSMEGFSKPSLLSTWQYPSNNEITSEGFVVAETFKIGIPEASASASPARTTPAPTPSASPTPTKTPTPVGSPAAPDPTSTAAATAVPEGFGNDVGYPEELVKKLEETPSSGE